MDWRNKLFGLKGGEVRLPWCPFLIRVYKFSNAIPHLHKREVGGSGWFLVVREIFAKGFRSPTEVFEEWLAGRSGK